MEKTSIKEKLKKADMGLYAEDAYTLTLMRQAVAFPLSKILTVPEYRKLREFLSGHRVTKHAETYGDLVRLAGKVRYAKEDNAKRVYAYILDVLLTGYKYELRRRVRIGEEKRKSAEEFPAFFIPLAELYHAAALTGGRRYPAWIYKNRMLPVCRVEDRRVAFLCNYGHKPIPDSLDPVIMADGICEVHSLGIIDDNEFYDLLYDLFVEPYLEVI